MAEFDHKVWPDVSVLRSLTRDMVPRNILPDIMIIMVNTLENFSYLHVNSISMCSYPLL